MDVDFLMSNKDVLSLVSKDIISYHSTYGVKTRAQTMKATSSCRMWQLIMCILDNLASYGYGIKELVTDGYGSDEYNALIAKISDVLDNIQDNRILNSLIYLNQIVRGSIVNYEPDAQQMTIGNNYLCIYIDGVSHSILHYFTIIQSDSGEYYLNSSYGSDYVCVNQYTTPISLDEFNRFIMALNNPGSDEDYIGEFFQKFFLSGNIGTQYSRDDYEEDRSLRFANIEPEEGNAREIAVVTQNYYRDKIRCGIMPGYNRLVGLMIHHGNLGGRKMRKQKRTRSQKRTRRQKHKRYRTKTRKH